MNPMRTKSLLPTLVLIAAPLGAQTVDKPSLTLDGARRVIAAAESYARQHQTTGVVAVVDDGGNLIYVERLDPTFPASAEIAIHKARTAALFQRPSKVLEDAISSGRTSLLKVAEAPLQGGEPIRVNGVIVGAIGVSGAASAARDEAIALVGAAALAATTSNR